MQGVKGNHDVSYLDQHVHPEERWRGPGRVEVTSDGRPQNLPALSSFACGSQSTRASSCEAWHQRRTTPVRSRLHLKGRMGRDVHRSLLHVTFHVDLSTFHLRATKGYAKAIEDTSNAPQGRRDDHVPNLKLQRIDAYFLWCSTHEIEERDDQRRRGRNANGRNGATRQARTGRRRRSVVGEAAAPREQRCRYRTHKKTTGV
mmetsp:Transcript_7104/g.43976  ORF Transcript_7104/g.43976 Transcript_7104/m.43976 type:complete len:202 (-) Transcript_7104:3360-3965(-)